MLLWSRRDPSTFVSHETYSDYNCVECAVEFWHASDSRSVGVACSCVRSAGIFSSSHGVSFAVFLQANLVIVGASDPHIAVIGDHALAQEAQILFALTRLQRRRRSMGQAQ